MQRLEVWPGRQEEQMLVKRTPTEICRQDAQQTTAVSSAALEPRVIKCRKNFNPLQRMNI